MAEKVRVRFAPSPTGYLHVGGARTALFNWLFARQQGGSFILRLEDTDEARNTEAARRTIFAGLRWLGLDPDEGPEQGGPKGPYAQSERGGIYRRHVEELKARGVMYPCFCTKERLAALRFEQEEAKASIRYDGRCRDLDPAAAAARLAAGDTPAWRLRVPPGRTVLEDMIRGTITVDHADVEDIILVRSDGSPIYNLAVVLDDHDMEVTHVLRGEDHLTNTFKQIILFRAMEWPLPRYGHLPLILGPAGEGKLSKRRHPEAALEHYVTRGYHPEAVVNWLALIGWSFDDKTEIMTRAELVERFSIERINKSGARLNLEKLAAISGEYIRGMPRDLAVVSMRAQLEDEGLLDRQADAATLERVSRLCALEQERIKVFSEIRERARWALRPLDALEPKALKNLQKGPGTAAWLRAWATELPDPLPEAAALEARARAFCEARGIGFGSFVHPLRAALTGRTVGPPLFDCVLILGREESLRRIEAAARLAEAGAAGES